MISRKKAILFEMAIEALQEIQQYRAIGTVKYFRECANILNESEADNLSKIIDEWLLYQKIGTVEECREAMERQTAKKPIMYKDTNRADCPICGATVRGIKGPFGDWCSKCGQELDWTE